MKSNCAKPTNKPSKSSINNMKEDLLRPSDLITNLIQKEINSCAQRIGIETEELQDWIDLHMPVPAKTILHLLRIARQYQLDPLQEEVLLTQYEDQWQAIISMDGWIKLINQHPAFTGFSFTESPETDQGLPLWMECTIYRSDRVIATTAREYLSEVKQESDIWHKMPRRMLRHRALQQCARLALGIYVNNSRERQLDVRNHQTKIPSPAMNELKIKPDTKITQVNKLKEILKT